MLRGPPQRSLANHTKYAGGALNKEPLTKKHTHTLVGVPGTNVAEPRGKSPVCVLPYFDTIYSGKPTSRDTGGTRDRAGFPLNAP